MSKLGPIQVYKDQRIVWEDGESMNRLIENSKNCVRAIKINNYSKAEGTHKNKEQPIVVKRVMIQLQDLDQIVPGCNQNHQRSLYSIQER